MLDCKITRFLSFILYFIFILVMMKDIFQNMRVPETQGLRQRSHLRRANGGTVSRTLGRSLALSHAFRIHN